LVAGGRAVGVATRTSEERAAFIFSPRRSLGRKRASKSHERLKEEEYDDSPWTREELQALAWERVKHEDWDEYDDLPEKP
jgi:hypothetical protein